MAYSTTSTEYLTKKIPLTPPPTAPESEAKALAAVLAAITSAKAPVLMLDGGAARQTWAKHVNPLIDALKIPVFNTLLGKGVADEYGPHYGGCFAGAGSTPKSVVDAIARSDCILWLGNLPSDFNT